MDFLAFTGVELGDVPRRSLERLTLITVKALNTQKQKEIIMSEETSTPESTNSGASTGSTRETFEVTIKVAETNYKKLKKLTTDETDEQIADAAGKCFVQGLKKATTKQVKTLIFNQ